MKRKMLITAILIIVLLVADQSFKIWVKTTMFLGEQIPVLGNWFNLHYIENDGMAFGMVFWTKPVGKIFLTLFRLFASGLILWVIHKMLHFFVDLPYGLVLCMTLIFAGAVGNVIDCIFYGQIFSASEYHGAVSTLFPGGGGYAPLFQGKVVDMLQFDLFDIPLGGAKFFHFFPAVFNLADSYITVGLLVMLIFYYRSLSVFVSSFERKRENSK